jgi:hypothetical protein
LDIWTYGHRRDVALWRIQKAAEAMGPIRAIFFDEGTRSDGQAGLVLGASGLMRDGTVNRRFCGVEFPLPNKLGSTIADAVLAGQGFSRSPAKSVTAVLLATCPALGALGVQIAAASPGSLHSQNFDHFF